MSLCVCLLCVRVCVCVYVCSKCVMSMSICVCLCMSINVCVCVCVCDRERERENMCVWERNGASMRECVYVCKFIVCMSVCICLCVRACVKDREREREREIGKWDKRPPEVKIELFNFLLSSKIFVLKRKISLFACTRRTNEKNNRFFPMKINKSILTIFFLLRITKLEKDQ